MCKLIVAVMVVGSLFHLASGYAYASPTDPNEVGLYLSPDATGPAGSDVMAPDVVEVYLVLTNPTDTLNDDAPFTTVDGFALTLNFHPVPHDGLSLVSYSLPQQSINLGDDSDIGQGFLEYIVGMAQPARVSQDAVVLMTLTFMNWATNITYVTLGPTASSGIPGQMTFQWDPARKRAMFPISGSHDEPVFLFNGYAVAQESRTFGSVKSLYR